MQMHPLPLNKTTRASLARYETRQNSAQIQYDPSDQYTQQTRHKRLGLAIAVIVMVPAVFWASVAWFVWGQLSAVIAATVVLVVSAITLALARSASGIETPVPAHLLPESRQAA